MANHHLRNKTLSLKAKGLLSLMLSLPEDWDYTTRGLSCICKDGVDSIRVGIQELEANGYLVRERRRNENGQYGAIEYTILEKPRQVAIPPPVQEKPILENPTQAIPMQDFPTQEIPAQLSIEESNTQKSNTDGLCVGGRLLCAGLEAAGGTPTYWALGTLAPVLSEIAPSHALQRANFVRQAPHRRCRSERAGGRQAGLDYPADDESRGRDRSHESGKSDVMGAVNELHPLPGRGNHQDGTNLLLREVKL